VTWHRTIHAARERDRVQPAPSSLRGALVFAAVFVSCGSSRGTLAPHADEGVDAGPSMDAGADGSQTGYDGSFFGSRDAAASCDGAPPACSGDVHSVVDCSGAVVQACDPSEGCSEGACVAACDAAAASKTSAGCEYYAHVPAGQALYGCYVLYVANTWTSPASMTGDVGGKTFDLAPYTYALIGTGPYATLAPMGAGGAIPPGQVGVVLLKGCSGMGGVVSGQTYAGVDSDPSASAWTDEVDGTNDTALALRVVASVPVVVYDIFPFLGGALDSTDAALLLPTSAWDTSYVAVTPWPYGDNEGPPAFSIVASSDGTDVVVTPTADIQSGTGVPAVARGQPTHFSLGKGQVLKFEQQADLLGSAISANKPIGVWGEQNAINIDQDSADSAHEQIAPVSALGSEYVYARYRNRLDGMDETPPTRIVGAVDGTTLTWDPAAPTGAQTSVNAGQSFVVRANGPFVVTSQDEQHPFYVSTYMTGGQAFISGGDPENWTGDPEFLGVAPVSGYLADYLFLTDPTYPETNLVFVRKKAQDGAFHDVVLDCAGTLGGWTAVDSAGNYEVTRRDLVRYEFAPQAGCDNGVHEAHSDGPFALTVWAWGTFSPYTTVSYAYPAGGSVRASKPTMGTGTGGRPDAGAQ
jgi:hypothetical protein